MARVGGTNTHAVAEVGAAMDLQCMAPDQGLRSDSHIAEQVGGCLSADVFQEIDARLVVGHDRVLVFDQAKVVVAGGQYKARRQALRGEIVVERESRIIARALKRQHILVGRKEKGLMIHVGDGFEIGCVHFCTGQTNLESTLNLILCNFFFAGFRPRAAMLCRVPPPRGGASQGSSLLERLVFSSNVKEMKEPTDLRTYFTYAILGVAFVLLALYKYVFGRRRRSNLGRKLRRSMGLKEQFAGSIASIEQAVSEIYMEVLQRQPKGNEMVDASRDLQSKRTTLDGLKQKLIDSSEYAMSIKTQDNSLAPELTKILSDKALIETLQKIFAEEKKKPLPEALLIPFKDIYVHLDYNEYTFRAFLRHSHYAPFVEDISREADLTKSKMLEIFAKHFDLEKLRKAGVKIAAEMGKMGKASLNTKTAGVRGRSIQESDNDSTAYLQSLYDEGAFVLDKNLAAAAAEGNSRMILTHHGDMVLRPEFAWSVPQQRPPVCTTLGKKPLVQPVMLPNKLLPNGTLLGDAADTEVGSIMPKIDYKEYIDLPKPSPNTKQPPKSTSKN